MNKLPRYHIIIHILICPIWDNSCQVIELLIEPDEKQDGGQWLHLSSHNRKGDGDENIWSIINIHIYVYVENHQNDIYFEKKKKLFALQIEFLPIYGKNSICSWRVYKAIINVDRGWKAEEYKILS